MAECYLRRYLCSIISYHGTVLLILLLLAQITQNSNKIKNSSGLNFQSSGENLISVLHALAYNICVCLLIIVIVLCVCLCVYVCAYVCGGGGWWVGVGVSFTISGRTVGSLLLKTEVVGVACARRVWKPVWKREWRRTEPNVKLEQLVLVLPSWPQQVCTTVPLARDLSEGKQDIARHRSRCVTTHPKRRGFPMMC